MDGDSTDGNFGILQKWKGDSHLGWHVSEPDSGIYNAMITGLPMRGESICCSLILVMFLMHLHRI